MCRPNRTYRIACRVIWNAKTSGFTKLRRGSEGGEEMAGVVTKCPFNLNTAVGYQFFTAKAQRSQRNAELCMWEDRKVGKPMELLGSPNG